MARNNSPEAKASLLVGTVMDSGYRVWKKLEEGKWLCIKDEHNRFGIGYIRDIDDSDFGKNWKITLPKEDKFDELYLRLK